MIPYFEGDFWPNVLEESIKELDQEEEEKRKREEAEAAAAEQEPECIDDGEGSNQVTLTLKSAYAGFYYIWWFLLEVKEINIYVEKLLLQILIHAIIFVLQFWTLIDR